MANTVKLKRGSGSDPSASDMVVGEPVIRTDTAELFFKKDDGSVAKVSGGGGGPDFKYLALRNAANNGSASYPGNDFTLVTSGTTNAITPAAANTLLVSYGGVIQKPNSGTSTSGITGFIVDGSRFKTATNLAAAPDFILYQESGGIGEPSDGTVTEAKLSVSNNPTNGYFLSAQSGNTGGLTWAAVDLSAYLPLAGGTITGDTTLANTKKVIFNASSGAGAFIKHQSGHFEIISSVGNTYFASAGTLYLRTNVSTNALTIDTSQNATFAGTATFAGGTCNGSFTVSSTEPRIYLTDTNNNSDFEIRNVNGTFRIFDSTNTRNCLGIDSAGVVELRHENAVRLQTSSTGITVTGKVNPTGNIHMPDNVGIKLGASDDLVLWHYNGDNKNYITSANARTLRIQADTGDETMAQFIPNGAVELYHNNVEMFYTSASGCHVGSPSAAAHLHFLDGGVARFGSSNDLEIYHSPSHGHIRNSTGNLYIYSADGHDGHVVIQATYGEESIICEDNGAVKLYNDNSLRLATTSGGVHIYNALSTSGEISIGNGANLVFEDNGKAVFGFGSDLSIYHDGGNSYIHDEGTGSLILRTGRVSFNDTGNNEMGRFDGEGLKFNGDTAAANALNDYETGTWTPTVFGGTTAGSYSYEAVRTGGKYTKIGNLVYIEGVVRISSITTAGAGTLNFGGLPFGFGSNPASAWNPGTGIQVTHYAAGSNSSVGDYPPPFVAIGNPSATTFVAYSYGKNYSAGSDITELSANSWIYQIAGCYQV